jgi:hypothetical protein
MDVCVLRAIQHRVVCVCAQHGCLSVCGDSPQGPVCLSPQDARARSLWTMTIRNDGRQMKRRGESENSRNAINGQVIIKS